LEQLTQERAVLAVLGGPAASSRIRQSSRFLAGASHDKLSGYYHFDSYVIGLIVPILLPEPGLGASSSRHPMLAHCISHIS
jgi:hypothetical protein